LLVAVTLLALSNGGVFYVGQLSISGDGGELGVATQMRLLFTVPTLVAVLVALIIPIWRVRAWWAAWRADLTRRAVGRCTVCGYDLRASPRQASLGAEDEM
jgi:hypothetical protein